MQPHGITLQFSHTTIDIWVRMGYDMDSSHGDDATTDVGHAMVACNWPSTSVDVYSTWSCLSNSGYRPLTGKLAQDPPLSLSLVRLLP